MPKQFMKDNKQISLTIGQIRAFTISFFVVDKCKGMKLALHIPKHKQRGMNCSRRNTNKEMRKMKRK